MIKTEKCFLIYLITLSNYTRYIALSDGITVNGELEWSLRIGGTIPVFYFRERGAALK
jgi:hypothetical protein